MTAPLRSLEISEAEIITNSLSLYIYIYNCAPLTVLFLPKNTPQPWCGCVLLSSCCGWGRDGAQTRPTLQTWLNTQLRTFMRNCILGRWCSSILSIKVGRSLLMLSQLCCCIFVIGPTLLIIRLVMWNMQACWTSVFWWVQHANEISSHADVTSVYWNKELCGIFAGEPSLLHEEMKKSFAEILDDAGGLKRPKWLPEHQCVVSGCA